MRVYTYVYILAVVAQVRDSHAHYNNLHKSHARHEGETRMANIPTAEKCAR